MQIVVLADPIQKEELLKGIDLPNVRWIEEEEQFLTYQHADAFLDLKFINKEKRTALLNRLSPGLVIINSVTETLAEINASFVRINGWNTFLSSSIIEASTTNEESQSKAEAVFAVFNKKVEWLQEEPGFITPRVVSMIINEAFIALSEGVSTKEEINTAMKLGTAYPYGPFEWAEKIGVQNIIALLQKLSQTRPHYTPAELLVQETNKAI